VTDVEPADRGPSIQVAFPAAGAGGPVDGVALVTLDRPTVLNALDFALSPSSPMRSRHSTATRPAGRS
jgi:hypothetical protein